MTIEATKDIVAIKQNNPKTLMLSFDGEHFNCKTNKLTSFSNFDIKLTNLFSCYAQLEACIAKNPNGPVGNCVQQMYACLAKCD